MMKMWGSCCNCGLLLLYSISCYYCGCFFLSKTGQIMPLCIICILPITYCVSAEGLCILFCVDAFLYNVPSSTWAHVHTTHYTHMRTDITRVGVFTSRKVTFIHHLVTLTFIELIIDTSHLYIIF